jgi:carboxymethylenebutenolidase
MKVGLLLLMFLFTSPPAFAVMMQGLAGKSPDLPASIWTAGSTVSRTKLRHEWVDIPVGNVKLHTWIEYPDGSEPAPVVIVMQHETGMDEMIRGFADQLAFQGFIAVAPDLHSGLGPNGGNFDSFKFPDDVVRANSRLSPAEVMRRYKAARDYAIKLPRANGKVGSIGFGIGGGYSFRFAGEVPELNAAVVFYGGPPDEATMGKIRAPVLGLYAGDDGPNTASVDATGASMKRLGKVYEPHVYRGATHSFAIYQVEGQNGAALADSWPRAIAFLREHLK